MNFQVLRKYIIGHLKPLIALRTNLGLTYDLMSDGIFDLKLIINSP